MYEVKRRDGWMKRMEMQESPNTIVKEDGNTHSGVERTAKGGQGPI